MFATLIRLLVFLFLLSVAAKNFGMVTIHYYLGIEWEVPVIVVIFICFAIGALFGYLSCFMKRTYGKD